MSPSLATTGLSFAWPDGTVVFDRLDLAVGPGLTGPARSPAVSAGRCYAVEHVGWYM